MDNINIIEQPCCVVTSHLFDSSWIHPVLPLNLVPLFRTQLGQVFFRATVVPDRIFSAHAVLYNNTNTHYDMYFM